ncbi:MAG: hypothetical protein K2O14_12190 [Oscillospiraceae bacterium]|nr:hypothetical protein [Oscillospiraceae bacterium]
MKKYTLPLIIAASILISGCASEKSSLSSETALGLDPLEGAAESSVVTVEPSAEFEPPILQMELRTAETVSCVNLTAGSYDWDENDVSRSSLTDIFALADTADAACINVSEFTGNPVLIPNGGEIVSAVCFRDSFDDRSCEITDGELTLCGGYDIYCVTVDYEQGSCDYIFKTVDSESPPAIRLRAGNVYRALSCSNYQWSVQVGEETYDTIACGAAPWECRHTAPVIDLSGEVKAALMLSDDAEIGSVYAYSADSSFEELPFNGRTFDLPDDPINKVYAVNVNYPCGDCEYVLSTFINGEPESPDIPESSEMREYPYGEICGLPPYTDTTETVPEAPVEPDLPPVYTEAAQPAPYTHHRENDNGHHGNGGHHGLFRNKPMNYISDCKLDNLSFYGYGFEVSAAENYKREYEGDITDPEVIAELWETITANEQQPELTEGYAYTGTPYLEITDSSTGKVYTVSYTTSVVYGSCGGSCPCVEGHVCEVPDTYTSCMRISCGISTEYAATNSEKRFNELIMNSLKQYEPVRDAVLNKSAKTDWIVFVEHYTNYAKSPADQGYFIDCYGNKYTFDFSEKRPNDDEDFFDALWQVYCDTNPIEYGLYDESSLFDILIDDIYVIDKNAEMSETSSGGADMGQTTLYAVDYDGQLIELRSEGNVNRCLEDDTAKRLCDFYDNERIL